MLVALSCVRFMFGEGISLLGMVLHHGAFSFPRIPSSSPLFASDTLIKAPQYSGSKAEVCQG